MSCGGAVIRRSLLAALLWLGLAAALLAEEMMFDNFVEAPETRWQFFADTVMGGVSTGQASFVPGKNGDAAHMRLTGVVSTANNGGFIQSRRRLENPLPADTAGLRLMVRGNGERYFIHLRTRGTRLPWQYYQAAFPTSESWTEVDIPLSAFSPSGRLLRNTPKAEAVTSVGLVAFGRDHQADVQLRSIAFYTKP